MKKDYIHFGNKAKPKLSLTESTKKVLEEEQIVIEDTDTTEDVIRKVSKSKKVVARIKEDGSVAIKQSLNG